MQAHPQKVKKMTKGRGDAPKRSLPNHSSGLFSFSSQPNQGPKETKDAKEKALKGFTIKGHARVRPRQTVRHTKKKIQERGQAWGGGFRPDGHKEDNSGAASRGWRWP